MLKKSRIIQETCDRASLMSILFISLLASSMTLIIPIAAQTLMNFVAFGKVLRPIVTICLIVLILMIGISILSVWQTIIIEMLQQRFLVITSLRMANKFIFASQNSLNKEHEPSLVNRFFDIITIRKAIATWLLYGFDMALQFVFCFVLLVIYHPVFILFDLFIVLGLILNILPLFKQSTRFANEECTAKHMLGGWLEEMRRHNDLFKFEQHSHFALKQMDKKLIDYLSNRKHYFKQLIKLHIGVHTLTILSTILLLGIGSYLVVMNQLSLGQLVAAELILSAMLTSFRRLPVMMENYYDLGASIKKIQGILSMSSEDEPFTRQSQLLPFSEGKINLQFRAVIFNTQQTKPEPPSLSAIAAPKNPLVILVEEASDSQNVINTILGIHSFKGEILINGVISTQEILVSLRHKVLLINKPTWFMGTITENLFLNHKKGSMKLALTYLAKLNLLGKIHALPDKMQTYIPNATAVFTEEELIKLMLIRACIISPIILLIDSSLDKFSINELGLIKAMLQALPQTTLIVTTFNEKVQRVLMEKT